MWTDGRMKTNDKKSLIENGLAQMSYLQESRVSVSNNRGLITEQLCLR